MVPTCLPVAVLITATRVVLVVPLATGVMITARVPSALINGARPVRLPVTVTLLPMKVTLVAEVTGGAEHGDAARGGACQRHR